MPCKTLSEVCAFNGNSLCHLLRRAEISNESTVSNYDKKATKYESLTLLTVRVISCYD